MDVVDALPKRADRRDDKGQNRNPDAEENENRDGLWRGHDGHRRFGVLIFIAARLAAMGFLSAALGSLARNASGRPSCGPSLGLGWSAQKSSPVSLSRCGWCGYQNWLRLRAASAPISNTASSPLLLMMAWVMSVPASKPAKSPSRISCSQPLIQHCTVPETT